MEYRQSIEEMYASKSNFIILGLTGRTGSGCTTVANILGMENFKDLDLKVPKEYDYNDAEERKYKVYYQYMVNEHWVPFVTLEVSSIILYFALREDVDSIKSWLNAMCEDKLIYLPEKESIFDELQSDMKEFFDIAQKYDFNKLKNESYINSEERCTEEWKEYFGYFTCKIKEIKNIFKSRFGNYICYQILNTTNGKTRIKHDFFTYFMQMLGNNLRMSGKPFKSEYCDGMYNEFIKNIVVLINFIKYYKVNIEKSNEVRVCIDAIRNPYEAHYLHDYYRSFYLIAIGTDDNDRRTRLKDYDFNKIAHLDEIEYPSKFNNPSERFYHQNIQECIECANIHLYNQNVIDGKYFDLTKQIIKYIALMLHPGLVTPSHIERCMQLAYNAKYNSGCLSRQVGAVVTRDDFSIQSVGWNDVPKGQVSCGLRDAFNYQKNRDESTYSEYECSDKEFSESVKCLCELVEDKMNGMPYPFCFKDIYNGIKKDKNQVYTRALHAEENAFLQISKYGGTQVKNGILFVTASPCELCSKKAFQLGIKKIYYIDPYPGIAKKQIISYKRIAEKPDMYLFYGAIGQAYLELYSPRMPYKDELELLTGIKPKSIINESNVIKDIAYGDLKYSLVQSTLEFNENCIDIKYASTVEGQCLCDGISQINRQLKWTGDKFNVPLKCESENCELLSDTSIGEYHNYTIKFHTKLKENDKFVYTISTPLRDSGKIMEKCLAYYIKHQTDKIILKLCFPKKENIKVVAREYADKNKTIKIKEETIKGEKGDYEDKMIYIFEKKYPNVCYTYSLEWEFED